MKHEEFINKSIKFICSKAKVSEAQVNAETNLIGSGIVDSLLLTELILHVEDTLDCNIEVENFRLSTFKTLNSIHHSYG